MPATRKKYSKEDFSEEFRQLGFAISYYRKNRNYTQEELAERLGISRDHLGAIESPNTIRGVSLELLFGIAAELDIEPYRLLKFSLNRPGKSDMQE